MALLSWSEKMSSSAFETKRLIEFCRDTIDFIESEALEKMDEFARNIIN